MKLSFSFKKLPVDSEGRAYESLEAFQAAMISKLIGLTDPNDHAAEDIVAHKDEVIEILALTMDCRPTARGQKRPRKPKAVEQPTLIPNEAA